MAQDARKTRKTVTTGRSTTAGASARAKTAVKQGIDKRTVIVLSSLLAAMTSSAALLLALEPSPIAPVAGAQLLSTNPSASPQQQLFDTAASLPWQGIVIYDSGSLEGNLQSLHKIHERMGVGGLGYHFVVDNGKGAPDGQIEVGFRWKRQIIGAHSTGEHADWFNQAAIGVCLVGDADRQAPTENQVERLLWLVRQLQQQYDIPSDRVYVRTGTGHDGGLFPVVSFRQQLLDVR